MTDRVGFRRRFDGATLTCPCGPQIRRAGRIRLRRRYRSNARGRDVDLSIWASPNSHADPPSSKAGSSGLELPPMVQDNIVNIYFSLASSQLTSCCRLLRGGTPELCPPDPSTIMADPLLQATLAGPSLLPSTWPVLPTGLSSCEIPVAGYWPCFVMPMYYIANTNSGRVMAMKPDRDIIVQ